MQAIGRVLVLLVLVATLVACGGSSSGRSKDTTAPVITLSGDNPQVIEAGTQYVELGATATDNRDGNLSNAIVIDASQVNTSLPGTYVVSYRASDAAGNSGTASRRVVVEDTIPPVITLLGDDPQVIIAGNPYIELGAAASDTLDGDLGAQIVVDATAVDTLVAGQYTVTYDVTDAAGNAAVTVTRTVQVELPPLPAAPTVSVEGDIKQLIFSWNNVANADYYRLMENPDGHSGFAQVGDDIPMGTHSATQDIAVHLLDWVNALYMIQACNLGGCSGSIHVSVIGAMLDTVGYIKASNNGLEDNFGEVVALSADGRTLAVGAPREDSGATGINGDQDDNSAESSGAVYVFRLEDDEWRQHSFIKQSNTETDDRFGYSIALSADGQTLAVGAARESSSSRGINGDQADNSAPRSGAVYVFRFDGADWRQQAYIKASNSDPYDWFGYSLALSADGNFLAVGAPYEDSVATGINGDQFDDAECGGSGAVFVFRFDGAAWGQSAYVKPSNTGGGRRDIHGLCSDGDQFGYSVAVSSSGAQIAVGAPYEDSLATGIDGDQSDAPDWMADEWDSGAVYIFVFDGASWSQQAYMKPSVSPAGYSFGRPVSLAATGGVLAVGAFGDDSNAIGVNVPPVDIVEQEQYEDSGSVHVFRQEAGNWAQESYIKATNPARRDRFGLALSLGSEGATLAVSARGEDGSSTGIGGDQNDDSSPNAGAVYVFRYSDFGWLDKAYVKAPNTDQHDWFGQSVALGADGESLAVGGLFEASSATGIDGDQDDNSAHGAGAVYVY